MEESVKIFLEYYKDKFINFIKKLRKERFKKNNFVFTL